MLSGISSLGGALRSLSAKTDSSARRVKLYSPRVFFMDGTATPQPGENSSPA
jgi:hypothetical protein